MEKMPENFEQLDSPERKKSWEEKLVEYAEMIGEMERREREENENWDEQKKFLTEKRAALETAIRQENWDEAQRIEAKIQEVFQLS